jgi:hypothetical protein
MKAIDYYNRDHAALFASPDMEGGKNLAMKLVKEFMNETKELIDSRKVSTAKGLAAIVNEQNKKWNALCNLYKDNHGVSPIMKNGYMRFYELLMMKKSYGTKADIVVIDEEVTT